MIDMVMITVKLEGRKVVLEGFEEGVPMVRLEGTTLEPMYYDLAASISDTFNKILKNKDLYF